ncbi:MAG: hypothetical protein CL663_01295 [Bacteroidetes bacterium]|nr:hypothetical protein [Bacteroidota bacterium]
MVRNWIKACIILGIILVSSSMVFSQNRTNSPYSLYGAGITNNIFDVKNAGMGGIAFGIREEANLNFANPASFTALAPKSFTFSAGMLTSSGTLNSSTSSEKVSNGTLSYLMFGFRVAKGWNTSVGLVPVSNSEYNFGSVNEDGPFGREGQSAVGNGGLNKFYWGNAFKLSENFSAGVNTSFVFGTLDRENQKVFLDTTTFLNTSVFESVVVKDFEFTFGLQYHKNIKEDVDLTIGAVYSPKVNLSAKRDYLVRSFSETSLGVDYFQDTITMELAKEGTLVFPNKYGVGFSLRKKDKWHFGMDMELENWSEYREYGAIDSLNSSFRVAAGGEYIPDKNNVYSYFKRMSYRFGVYYENSNLTLRNTKINEYGISFGIGLPMKRSKSAFNIAVEYGQRGTTANNLIKEKYLRFRLGITLHQKWFEQRKYY